MKKKAKLDDDTGKPLPEEKWPRIAQAPHILDGHAHLRASKVPVFKVLRELTHEPLTVPRTLASKGVTAEDLKAALAYSSDLQEHWQRLILEVKRLHGITDEGPKRP